MFPFKRRSQLFPIPGKKKMKRLKKYMIHSLPTMRPTQRRKESNKLKSHGFTSVSHCATYPLPKTTWQPFPRSFQGNPHGTFISENPRNDPLGKKRELTATSSQKSPSTQLPPNARLYLSLALFCLPLWNTKDYSLYHKHLDPASVFSHLTNTETT